MAWDRDRATAEFAAHIAENRPRPQTVRAWMRRAKKELGERQARFPPDEWGEDEAERKLKTNIEWWEEVLALAAQIRRAMH